MAKTIRKQVYSLKPMRAQVPCAFCGSVTWWAKRPELVYRGSHRYARWVCESCGRTSPRAKQYAEALATTVNALRAGPGTKQWAAYGALETCF